MNRLWRSPALWAYLLAVMLAAPPPAAAETMSFEEAGALLGASCGKDIDDNCRGVNLDPVRLKDCLLRNQDVVSAQCKADYPRVFGAVQQRAAARAGVFRICGRDAARLCAGAEKAEMLQCLGTAKRGVSIQCSKTITDAGYR
ncbi:MAG TPA: hypothetical protein VFQ87_14595 [Bradyrhizobium sp.]|jgi:hypothetical protein|nr:hypothetical protein [Bradyrhizobium sp.]